MIGEEKAVLDFWFRELTPAQWFQPDPEIDAVIRDRFSGLMTKAKAGELDSWAATPRGRLALILVLDQMSRNIFRNQAEAYAGDAKAQVLAKEAVVAEMDASLTFEERHFLYMPLMHAEDAHMQALSVEKFLALKADANLLVRFAEGHRGVIDRFGRFPYRNNTLGRTSTAEEEVYLASKGEFD